MKKVISILFFLAMLLQAIPVLHYFSYTKAGVYFAMDEEKPNEKNKESKEDKQDDKISFSSFKIKASRHLASLCFHYYSSQLPSCPHLQMLTPPPDFC